jgi:hypothetical protein
MQDTFKAPVRSRLIRYGSAYSQGRLGVENGLPMPRRRLDLMIEANRSVVSGVHNFSVLKTNSMVAKFKSLVFELPFPTRIGANGNLKPATGSVNLKYESTR